MSRRIRQGSPDWIPPQKPDPPPPPPPRAPRQRLERSRETWARELLAAVLGSDGFWSWVMQFGAPDASASSAGRAAARVVKAALAELEKEG